MNQFMIIPEELKQLPQWVCHKNKIPFNPLTGAYAKAGQPTTWARVEDAMNAFHGGGYDGIGFEFNNNGIVGIDLDHVIAEDGSLSEEAVEIVAILDSYTEYSPSGKGLHIFVRGDIPVDGRKKSFIEMYKAKRYFTMTGNVYGDLKHINERTEQVMQIFNKYFTNPISVKSTMEADIVNSCIKTGKDYLSIGLDKDTVFKALWNGEYQSEKCTSESEKDLALIGKLLYWCSGNAEATIEAFKASPYAKDNVTIDNETQKTAYQKHILKMGSRAVRETMVKDARDKYCISNEDLDKNLDLLNLQNGTLNLETFEFREHRATDLISKIANVSYDPAVKSELWLRFIDEVMIGDIEKTEYLQKAIGYGITADTSLETCFILYGATTRNGKSTLVETIMHMLGGSSGYAMQMKLKSLAQKQNNDSRQANGDIARLAGARFLNVSEPPKKMIFDAALLKTLLGRDSIVARHLHEREFEFVPLFKLFMNTNYLPHIQDDTLFSSGRINVISFERHFGEHEQDKSLKNKLRIPENLSGMLNWCLEGLRKFHTEGLKPTKEVVEATADYRQESDKVGKFLAECLEPANENITAGTAYEVYEQWCRACAYGCENQGNFFAELRAKNLISKTGTVNGVTKSRVIKGYRVAVEFGGKSGSNSKRSRKSRQKFDEGTGETVQSLHRQVQFLITIMGIIAEPLYRLLLQQE